MKFKQSFSSRLFRLFLISSITPAIIVAAVGYYLASQSGSFEPLSKSNTKQSLSKYYNDMLYNSISSGLDRYQSTKIIDTALVDFLFTFQSNEIYPNNFSGDIIEEIKKSSLARLKGWVESDNSYLQYLIVCLPDDTIAAGLIHGDSFYALTSQVQGEQSRLTSRNALRGEYFFFLLVAFLSLTGITIAANYLLASRISRRLASPLVELAKAARRISSGDFKQQVELSGDSEIRQLISSFNQMSNRLSDMTERLTQTERVAAWRQVARRFAHELKNPIQPILISLYQIEKKLANNPAFDQIEQPLKAATEELNHLTLLAERFSTLAKMPEVKIEPSDLVELIKSVVKLYHSDEKSKVVLTANYPDQPVMAKIDYTYFREALHNLILNGQEACHNGGSMTLTLLETDNEVIVSLEDDGIGMDPDTLAAARLPYFSTKAKGSGLGLAIVEKSINEMNGRLKVQSQSGQGTKVSIILSSGPGELT